MGEALGLFEEAKAPTGFGDFGGFCMLGWMPDWLTALLVSELAFRPLDLASLGQKGFPRGD